MEFNPLHFTDKNGNQLQLGDFVKATKGRFKGYTLIFTFCVPQHRFGFIIDTAYNDIVENKDKFGRKVLVEDYALDIPNLQFYYTPSNVSIISKI